MAQHTIELWVDKVMREQASLHVASGNSTTASAIAPALASQLISR